LQDRRAFISTNSSENGKDTPHHPVAFVLLMDCINFNLWRPGNVGGGLDNAMSAISIFLPCHADTP